MIAGKDNVKQKKRYAVKITTGVWCADSGGEYVGPAHEKAVRKQCKR